MPLGAHSQGFWAALYSQLLHSSLSSSDSQPQGSTTCSKHIPAFGIWVYVWLSIIAMTAPLLMRASLTSHRLALPTSWKNPDRGRRPRKTFGYHFFFTKPVLPLCACVTVCLTDILLVGNIQIHLRAYPLKMCCTYELPEHHLWRCEASHAVGRKRIEPQENRFIPWSSSTQREVDNASKPAIVGSCIYCPNEDLKSPDIFSEQ